MTGARPAREYSTGEEIANAVTHGLGVALSIAALVLMVVRAAGTGDPAKIVSAVVFGTCLVLLYLSSTLYHSLSPPKAKRVFKVLDHSAIYLLIAGTYTPFALVTLRGLLGWALFALLWALAVAGVCTEAFWVNRPRWLSALIYIGMGWIAVLAWRPLVDALPRAALGLLLLGGVLYTVGTIFYVIRRVPYMHAVWHLWVIGGSTCHVLAVLLYVL